MDETASPWQLPWFERKPVGRGGCGAWWEIAAVWEGRRDNWQVRPGDARDAAEVDYGRIVHSASFRRLQGKTQVLGPGDGDFYRTRLTHSMEVSQLAGGLVTQFAERYASRPEADILPPRALVQAIGLTHDLGHPPFGHGGEVALNYCMRDGGGFEGNGQTLRILAKLEKFSADNGANLSRRTLLGVLKYPVPYSMARNPALVPKLHDRPTTLRLLDRQSSKPPKCYLDCDQDVVDWVLQPLTPDDRLRFCESDDPGTSESPKHRKA